MTAQRARRVGRTAVLLAAALLGAVLAGCGYTTKPLHPTDVKTVSVPVVVRGEPVYRRDLEFQLTEALVKRIEQDTPYKVTKPARADTELGVTIDVVRQQVLSSNSDTGLARELDVALAIRLTWTDLRTGEQRLTLSNLRATGNYVPQAPLSETYFLGSRGAVNRAAELIVEQMERGIPAPGGGQQDDASAAADGP